MNIADEGPRGPGKNKGVGMVGSLAVGLLLIVVAGLAVVIAVVMLVVWQVTKRPAPLSYGEPSQLPQDSLAD